MMRVLRYIPFFVILLPVFFVLHGYLENFGYIEPGACVLLTAEYIGAAGICCGIFFLLYRDWIKASLMTTALLAVYFFFGSVHDLLYDHAIFLHRYIILLPLLLLALVYLLIRLRRTRGPFTGTTLFLNTLLIIYVFFDGTKTAWKAFHPQPNWLSVYDLTPSSAYVACDSCRNPDIYFLVFDEYASSKALKEGYGYDNSGLDRWLRGSGFHVMTNSRGNYNYTPFCMASILNMSYLQGFRTGVPVDVRDFASCNTLIRNNEVIRFLGSRGYEIVNYSIFDLAGHPSPFNQFLLPVKTNLITERTLFHAIYRDLGWHLYTLPAPISRLFGDITYKSLEDNNAIFERTIAESKEGSERRSKDEHVKGGQVMGMQKKNAPRFVYAHFEMPHSPFYFDSNGAAKPEQQLVKEVFQVGDPKPYLGYLPYTNGRIRELVTDILEHTHDSAVIILMGDHGYRENIPDSAYARHFENLNAVYFPDRDYHLFYDSVSGVNQFRLVFDKLFKQNFILLRDSTITLRDNR